MFVILREAKDLMQSLHEEGKDSSAEASEWQ